LYYIRNAENVPTHIVSSITCSSYKGLRETTQREWRHWGRDGGGEKKITRLVGCATVYVLIRLEWLQSVRILDGLSVV